MEMTAVSRAAITPSHDIEIAANGGGTPYGYGMQSTRQGQNWYFVEEADTAGQDSSAYVDVDLIHGNTLAHYRVSMRNGWIHVVKT